MTEEQTEILEKFEKLKTAISRAEGMMAGIEAHWKDEFGTTDFDTICELRNKLRVKQAEYNAQKMELLLMLEAIVAANKE